MVNKQMNYEEILDEIQNLQTEIMINQKRIKYLTDQLISGQVKNEDTLSVRNTLSYKLGNLLINTKKDHVGIGKIFKGLISLKVESLQNKKKKGIEVGKFDKFLYEALSLDNEKNIQLINDSVIEVKKSFSNIVWNEIEINNFTSSELSIDFLPVGEYEFKLSYTDVDFLKNRKSIYIGFGSQNIDNIITSTGIGLSDKAGPFFYIGGGLLNQEKKIIEQTYRLKVKQDLENLKIKIYCNKSDSVIKKLEFYRYFELSNVKLIDKKNSINLVEKKSIDYTRLKNINVEYILYADINVNVVDGSSVWFSSMASVLSHLGNVAIILKENPRSQQILSNINKKNEIVYIDPNYVDYNEVLNIDDSINIIKAIDCYSSKLKLVVVRGIDVAFSLHQDNQFYKRTASYVTDFYNIENGEFIINHEKLKKLKLVTEKTEVLITQTEEIKNKIFEITNNKIKTVDFVPCLPKESLNYFNFKKSFSRNKKEIKIGYAGKITPTWGVVELLEWVKKIQQENDIKIKLYIASNKISAPENGKTFRNYIHSFMKELEVEYFNDFNRDACMKMLDQMDFVWCWRPSQLEDNTLELSTKLLEAAVTGSRIINYPSAININVLGAEYPFYIKSYREFEILLKKKFFKAFNGELISNKIYEKHTLDKQIEVFFDEFVRNKNVCSDNKKILFASHDFKFIDPYISSLKAKGYSVRKEVWDWGGHKKEKILMDNYDWADVIFCEWGLANATWYSKVNVAKKPLFIRMHAQEVRERAQKFGNQITWENVTKVIFVSNEIKSQALKLWSKMPNNKITKIPNYLLDSKLNYITNKFNELDEVRIGILGIVPQTKRYDIAVNLLNVLRKNNINAKLYVKGYRPEELEFMHAPSRKHELDYYYDVYNFIEKNNLSEHIFYEKWDNNVNQWYGNLHFILSPSDNESFHYALADGIVAGCYPLLWNWKGYNEVYPFIESVIENLDDGINHIKYILSMNPKDIDCKINSYRNSLLSLYSQESVFENLNSEII